MSSSRHPLLERQLKRLGLTVESLPAPMAALVELVDRTYRTADQDRYLLERSLTISSQEMQSLYEALRAASESRVSEMEMAVSEARASAEAASRAKSEFLANISHEIRTPLNAVIGMTSVLLGSELSPEHRDHVQTIRKSGEALLGLINEILDFSRLEAGRMPLEEHPFLLRERIAIAFELVAQEARRKGLRLSWETEPGCPDVLVGDAARLQQILLNLLYNAVKFTPSGEVTLRAGLVDQEGAAENGDDVVLRFRVSDTGVGLPPGRIEELFGPFLQADASTSRRYGGSGLGLAISRRLVERMGGEITAQGEPGRGSIFTFTVRFRRGNEEELASAALLSQEQIVQPPLHPPGTEPLRILLAEDNPLNQKVARLLLEKLGYGADLAANGHEVLTALERQDYDVVLMDVMMPELDGLEATRRIVARWPPEKRPRIVALTASAMREDRERCLAAGMDEYLSKPIDLPALAEALQRAALRETEIPALPMIDELWRLDPQETVRLVESFLVHLELELGSLREAVKQGDGGTIEKVAHSLRGACATLGLPRLPDSLGELIHLVRGGEGRKAAAALAAVDQDAAREREMLRKVLATRAAGTLTPGPSPKGEG